jgi:urease accessory protein
MDRLQRATGHAQLAVKHTQTGTAIETLHQSGCLKLRFPRRHTANLEAVLINISGGVTDGDSLAITLAATQNTHLTLTTPAAERIYGAMPGAPPARIATTAHLAENARLDYLPQETILFDSAALHRTLDIHLHPTATFLAIEARLFGRPLSGETVATLHVTDRVRIIRAGQLVLHEAIRLHGNVQPILQAQEGAHGHTAIATLLYAAPDAAALLPPLRAALHGADAGASTWNGLLMARLIAPNGHALRRALIPALQTLRQTPLPRLWAS